jgi:hypothetical protein
MSRLRRAWEGGGEGSQGILVGWDSLLQIKAIA